jgi:hypothetical protein
MASSPNHGHVKEQEENKIQVFTTITHDVLAFFDSPLSRQADPDQDESASTHPC